jgi:hypothetical protein
MEKSEEQIKKELPVESPRDKLDFLHEWVSPCLFGLLFSLYCLDLGDWTIYLLIPGSLFQAALLLSRAGLALLRGEWWGPIRSATLLWFSAMGPKRRLWLFQALSFTVFFVVVCFVGRTVHDNVNVTHLVRTTADLMRSIRTNARDPEKLMDDFELWLHATPIGQCFALGRYYFKSVGRIDKDFFFLSSFLLGATLAAATIQTIYSHPYRFLQRLTQQ